MKDKYLELLGTLFRAMTEAVEEDEPAAYQFWKTEHEVLLNKINLMIK